MRYWVTLRNSHTRFPTHSISHFYDLDLNIAACGISFAPSWRDEYISTNMRAQELDFVMVRKCETCELLEIMEELAE